MALQSAVEGLETAQAAKTIGAAFQVQTPAQPPLPEQLVMAEEAAAQIQARLPQEEKLAEVNALLAAEADPEAGWKFCGTPKWSWIIRNPWWIMRTCCRG